MKPVVLATIAAAAVAGQAMAAPKPPAGLEALRGVYRAIGGDVVLPGGLRNTGSLDAIKGAPPPADADANALVDPARVCQPIGPFRMMARPDSKIELIPKDRTVFILFQDIPHGYWRAAYLDRPHGGQVEPSFQGETVGRWDGEALNLDTVGLNAYTWLNGKGARHSDALRIVERIRPILEGRYLEYRVTAQDPKALPRPFTYTRYYKRVRAQITEDSCVIDAGGR